MPKSNDYTVNHVLELPELERRGSFGEPIFSGKVNRIEPGSTVSSEDLEKSGQSDEDIKGLLDRGVLSDAE